MAVILTVDRAATASRFHIPMRAFFDLPLRMVQQFVTWLAQRSRVMIPPAICREHQSKRLGFTLDFVHRTCDLRFLIRIAWMCRIKVASFLSRDNDPADKGGAETVVFHLIESGNGDAQWRGNSIDE